MKTASRSGRRGVLTGMVQALCGCIGDAGDDGLGQGHKEFPVVYVHLIVPCDAGHPATMAAGCIERFPPHAVRPFSREKLAEMLRAPVEAPS